MKKLKNNIRKLQILSFFSFVICIIAIITLFVALGQRDEARNDANKFFDELKEYQDTQIVLDSLKQAKKSQEMDALIRALIIIESEGVEEAIGDGGQAVGILQLHPGVIEDLRTAGYNYSLNDRYNREKSIEMWQKWMEIWIPDGNIHGLLKKHNPRMSFDTHMRILRLKDLILEQNE